MAKKRVAPEYPAALTCTCGASANHHCAGERFSHSCPWYDCQACKSRLAIVGPKESDRWPVRRRPIPSAGV
jgi:hypothetical protein